MTNLSFFSGSFCLDFVPTVKFGGTENLLGVLMQGVNHGGDG